LGKPGTDPNDFEMPWGNPSWHRYEAYQNNTHPNEQKVLHWILTESSMLGRLPGLKVNWLTSLNPVIEKWRDFLIACATKIKFQKIDS
jgi:hypothetical protein